MRRFLHAIFQEVAMTNPFTRLFRARDKPSKVYTRDLFKRD